MQRRLSITLSDVALDLVADTSFDPTYGARPLKRALQRLVLDPLAKRMLEGDLVEGACIRVGVADRSLVFDTEQPATV